MVQKKGDGVRALTQMPSRLRSGLRLLFSGVLVLQSATSGTETGKSDQSGISAWP